MLRREEYRLGTKRITGLNPITYGQEKCESGFSVNVPRPYWLLHYVIAGKGTFETGNSVYPIGPSQIFVVRPHQTHRYTADAADPWHYMWIAFDSDVPLPDILGSDVITAPGAGRIFADCLTAAQLDAGREEFLSGKIWELLSLFLQMESGKAAQPNPYILRAKQYIEENYLHGIKITDIAKTLNLDRSYFSTLFKRETGMAPQEYLAEYRLQQAAQLLMQGDTSVAAAAALVGYNDIVNFSRMFKKHFGIAPSRYREMILVHEGTL